MNSNSKLPFLEDKLRVIQAAEELKAVFSVILKDFKYREALRTHGAKAMGLYYFYCRTQNLLTYISIHDFFRKAAEVYKNKYGNYCVHNPNSTLSEAYTKLQTASSELEHRIFEEKGLRNSRAEKDRGIKWSYKTSELDLGMEILKMIRNAQPEKYWTDMYEQGFKNSIILRAKK